MQVVSHNVQKKLAAVPAHCISMSIRADPVQDQRKGQGLNEETITTIASVAERHAIPGVLTDHQRDEALAAIELFRALSPTFLDESAHIIQGGTSDNATLFHAATNGARISTALTQICKALWTLEDAVHARRTAQIARMGKEEDTHA